MKNFWLRHQPLLLTIFALALIGGAFSLYRRWQPEEQVRRHQALFFESIEEGDWKTVDRLLSSDFKTSRGDDRVFLLREGREYRRHFFALTFSAEDDKLQLPTPDEGKVEMLLRMKGNGSAIAQLIMDRVNSSRAPFHFRWKKQSWKPWDWQLTSIEHPLLKSRY